MSDLRMVAAAFAVGCLLAAIILGCVVAVLPDGTYRIYYTRSRWIEFELRTRGKFRGNGRDPDD